MLVFVVAFVSGCAATPVHQAIPPLLLVSLDAFRWDYCARYPAETVHLRQLMGAGASARALIPVYPSNTFPNHYSIVTGLYPSHHGVINNHFFDPTRGEFFHYNQAGAKAGYWWGGEPIWVTAIKQGRKAATSFWVGSEAEIAGVRPTFWRTYDYSLPFEKRVEELISWLQLPVDQRPSVITFYLEETNSVGHKFGPDSPELAAAVKLVDSRLGTIMDRLRQEGITANLIVVSDHGMTPISPQRVVLLDDYLDLSTVQVDFEETTVGLRPLPGIDPSTVIASLSRMPHAKAWRVEDLPRRFHVTSNPRNPPIWVVPEEGWEIVRRAQFERYADKFNKGDHGFDPAFKSMHGVLIAQGPDFKNDGTVVDAVENIHIYNLMCALLHLTPALNDGDERLIRWLRRP